MGWRPCDLRATSSLALGFRGGECYLTPKVGLLNVPEVCNRRALHAGPRPGRVLEPFQGSHEDCGRGFEGPSFSMCNVQL